MQSGMLVLRLAEAARRHDQGAITRVLRVLVEQEEKKKRGGIADQLRRLIPRTGADGQNDKALEYLAETTPRLSLHDLQLQPAVRRACEELILEQQKADVLARAGMRPRNRILLTGPAGNGKTSVAEAIAAALGRPFYAVTYDTLTGNLLGQTSSRLRKVFEYVTSHDCVVLFDEFEAIGKERDDRQDVGELKRVVASMLLQMDQAPSVTVIAAATNHPEMLDRAAWRRFQIRLELERPSRNELARYFKARGEKAPHLRLDASKTADTLQGTSYAEAAEFCDDVERQQVLHPDQDPASLFQRRLALWTGNHEQAHTIVRKT